MCTNTICLPEEAVHECKNTDTTRYNSRVKEHHVLQPGCQNILELLLLLQCEKLNIIGVDEVNI